MLFCSKIALPIPDGRIDPEIAQLFESHADATLAFLSHVAKNSSFLRTQIFGHAAWLDEAMRKPPKLVFEQMLKGIEAVQDDTIAVDFRHHKQRAALVLALCEISKIMDVHDTTQILSEIAEAFVDRGLSYCVSVQSGLKAHADRIFVIGMGKLGAQELNYSSDIDIISFFDDEDLDPLESSELRVGFVKVIRHLNKLLNDVTKDGYVFRVDLRLRPNPSVTPVCIGTRKARAYYASDARTWERAAYIKARIVGGSREKGAAFLARIEEFLWRKHLDFAAIKDIEDIQGQIREVKNIHSQITVPGHDVKLGRGGIREIEFFVQTRQLLLGGREIALRLKKTTDGLNTLASLGIIDAAIATRLLQNYRDLRRVEHAIQMRQDAQTHSVPTQPDAQDQVAALLGFERFKDFEIWLEQILTETHEAASLSVNQNPDGPIQIAEPARPLFEDWLSFPTFKNTKTVELFEQLSPIIDEHINNAPEPVEMRENFALFLQSLSEGLRVFSLFEARHDILLTALDISAISSELARQLGREANMLDGLAFASSFTVLPDNQLYLEMLEHRLSTHDDFETQLNLMRRWRSEQHFLIVLQQLRGAIDIERAQNAYTDLAQACLEICLRRVQDEHQRRFGTIKGASVAILAMGKFASREMTSTSDLDLILIFDAEDNLMSDGQKGLDTRTYFARLTKTLISALSVPMTDGALYEVDMRLRPSGRKGPVATSFASFEAYQLNDAWVWEHLALVRSQVMVGDRDLKTKIEGVRARIINRSPQRAQIFNEVAEMRGRLHRADPTPDDYSVKKGQGGSLDIELACQALCLIDKIDQRVPKDQLTVAAQNGAISPEDADALAAILDSFKAIEHGKRLLLKDNFSISKLSGLGRRFMLDLTQSNDLGEIVETVALNREKAHSIIQKILNDANP